MLQRYTLTRVGQAGISKLRIGNNLNLQALSHFHEHHHQHQHSKLQHLSHAVHSSKRYSSKRSATPGGIEQSMDIDTSAPKRRLDVAIVGAPNAGKSQLINSLTQATVAAVSRKRHTTRNGILGARTVGNTQIVFRDTPGFMRLEHAKEERLDRDLIVSAAAEMEFVDFTLLVVDSARRLSDTYRQALIQLMLNAVKSQGRNEEDDDVYVGPPSADGLDEGSVSATNDLKPKFAIVLNKVDLVSPKSQLLDFAMDIGDMADQCLKYQVQEADAPDVDFTAELDPDILMKIAPIVFYVSAKENDGTDDLLQHLVDLSTPSQVWAVPPGQVSDLSEEERVQELIREKIYRCLHREVPHNVQQVNRLFRRVTDGLIIHQDLVVATKSHKRLVMGHGNKTLRRIHETAARSLEEMFGCNISLRLHVKHNKTNAGDGLEDYRNASNSQSIQ